LYGNEETDKITKIWHC